MNSNIFIIWLSIIILMLAILFIIIDKKRKEFFLKKFQKYFYFYIFLILILIVFILFIDTVYFEKVVINKGNVNLTSELIDNLRNINKTLNTHLADNSISQKRHEEIIEAIKSIQLNQQIRTNVNKLKNIIWVGGLISSILGILLLIIGFLKNNKWLKIFGTLLSLGSLTIVQFSDLTLFKSLISKQDNIKSSLFINKIGTVGYFETGESKIHRDSIPIKISQIVNQIKKEDKKVLNAIILIGHADKRQLLYPFKSIYGSNSGLALKRAQYIDSLLSNCIEIPSRITLNAGPRQVGFNIPNKKLAEDRVVEIYGIWAE